MKKQPTIWYYACPHLDYIMKRTVLRVLKDRLLVGARKRIDGSSDRTYLPIINGHNVYYPTRQEAVTHLVNYWTDEIYRIEQASIAAVAVLKDKRAKIGV